MSQPILGRTLCCQAMVLAGLHGARVQRQRPLRLWLESVCQAPVNLGGRGAGHAAWSTASFLCLGRSSTGERADQAQASFRHWEDAYDVGAASNLLVEALRQLVNVRCLWCCLAGGRRNKVSVCSMFSSTKAARLDSAPP